jgi:nucleotide-binding universal stress UspA family protein
MREINKRILLTVDGTAESLSVVRYVSETLHPVGTEVCVYHVISKVPEVFWDLGNDPDWSPKIEAIREYEQKQEEIAVNFVNKSAEILKDAGFQPENVHTRLVAKHIGIARDILVEARRGGYDVLVIGRGQVGSLQNMPLGSVASKIVSAVSAPSLWLVGGKPSSGKILVAIDSSANALAAVKHAGKMLSHGKNSITLFHAIRGIEVSGEGMEDIFPDSYRHRLQEDAEKGIRGAFKSAEIALRAMDISPDRISTKIVTSASSRAEAIFNEANTGGYGTIVAGRRGLSVVFDFSMGRVTNKLTQLAREQALCIVG